MMMSFEEMILIVVIEIKIFVIAWLISDLLESNNKLVDRVEKLENKG